MGGLPRVAAEVEKDVDLRVRAAVLLGPTDLVLRDLQVLALHHGAVEVGVVEVADGGRGGRHVRVDGHTFLPEVALQVP